MTNVFAGNGVDDIVRRSPKKLRNDRKLVDVVLAREQRFPFEHLRKDTSRTPDIHLDVVLLPCEHDLWGTIIPSRDVSRHLRILDAGKAKVTNLQVAILVD